MRIIRGKGRRPKTSPRPTNLLECEDGKVVLIPVQVRAHFAGAGRGDYSDVLIRPYHWPTRECLYGCGDLYVTRASLVPVYEVDE